MSLSLGACRTGLFLCVCIPDAVTLTPVRMSVFNQEINIDEVLPVPKLKSDHIELDEVSHIQRNMRTMTLVKFTICSSR